MSTPSKCLLCGNARIYPFSVTGLWSCDRCKVVFQYPQNDFDYSNYEDEHRIPKRPARIQQYKLDIEDISRHKSSGRFLDVGCGSGTFLGILPSDKYTKDGIDIRGNYKIGNFEEYCFKDLYDVVHMRGTIEHLKNPLSYIRKAYDVLKSDGILVVSHVPNIDNYPKMEKLIIPDEHLFYFNVDSMTFMLTECKFKILNINFPYYGTPYEGKENAHFMNVLTVYSKKA